MSITKDEHAVQTGAIPVVVAGATGKVHATWNLLVGGAEVDRAAAAGGFSLRGPLPDCSEVRADIHQSLFGPTKVAIRHGDDEIGTFQGFVA